MNRYRYNHDVDKPLRPEEIGIRLGQYWHGLKDGKYPDWGFTVYETVMKVEDGIITQSARGPLVKNEKVANDTEFNYGFLRKNFKPSNITVTNFNNQNDYL